MNGSLFIFGVLLAAIVAPVKANKEFQTFDFIVCGVGASGAAVASRLSENPSWTVLALDKGPKAPQPFAEGFNFLPKYYNILNMHDPAYFSVPQPGLSNRMLYSARYEGLGGTSQIYGASARRPGPANLDQWPKGWNYADLLPYFIKMEDHYCYYDDSNITQISPSECRKWHGKGGPVQINGPVIEAFEPFTRDYLRTLVGDTFFGGYSPDQNGDPSRRSGVALWQKFRYRKTRTDRFSPQTRVSSESAYLTPDVQKRPNLELKPGCPVLKILFDNNNRATGVQYFDMTTNQVITAHANKEVIISGGAFGTPQLLQVSGVGDKNMLEPLGITTIVDNPHVGKHLWEHLTVRLLFNTTVRFPFTSQADFDKFSRTNPTMELVNGVYPVSAHLASGFNPPGVTDMQIYLWEGQYAKYDIQPIMGNPSAIFSGIPAASFLLVNQFPEANEGSVSITSPASIFNRPVIDYNITKLTSTDRAVLKTLLQKMLKVVTDTPFAEQYSLGVVSPAPGEDLDDYLDKNVGIGWHPTGTCRLGDCTDEFLVVKGTKNVRVVDASAFATQVDANTFYLAVAMAEKLSDMIKADWQGL